MGPGDVTSPAAVRQAVRECDALGRDDFLAKYGFVRSRKFVVVEDDREYDSKARLAAAHGFEHPDQGPLPNNFSGGYPTAFLNRSRPTAQEEERYRWSARWKLQDRLAFAPRSGNWPRSAADTDYEIGLRRAA